MWQSTVRKVYSEDEGRKDCCHERQRERGAVERRSMWRSSDRGDTWDGREIIESLECIHDEAGRGKKSYGQGIAPRQRVRINTAFVEMDCAATDSAACLGICSAARLQQHPQCPVDDGFCLYRLSVARVVSFAAYAPLAPLPSASFPHLVPIRCSSFANFAFWSP
ncbi:hypothetical protein BC939DRAFT_454979 [Gamsiella multidivaricata]|uniref:uncharacterized protein n=1 Tax=Gamsiella multidivaricata TaxID=101098 RepID=UPI00221F9D67|nr:uncharacterized protein BC939DRAFT_454979 [Gamsiella multidivaricata]KAI7821938.1 hypothetical protein BC939DRAFT_454979 [Gamsiella multidivaricata]